jgi:hypothetical protein
VPYRFPTTVGCSILDLARPIGPSGIRSKKNLPVPVHKKDTEDLELAQDSPESSVRRSKNMVRDTVLKNFQDTAVLTSFMIWIRAGHHYDRH